MHSLRWRIAFWYALLLVLAMAAIGIAITLRFESILRSQAQEHLISTLQDIARTTESGPGAFTFSEENPLPALESPDTLERWASATTFIEVDDLRGYPLAKSFNMDALAPFGFSGVTAARPQTTRTVTLDRRPFLVTSALLTGGGLGVVVQVGEPLDQLNRALSQSRFSIAVILLVAAVAVAALAYIIAAQVTTPLARLAEAMAGIGSEGLSRRLRWKGRSDEVARLAREFDDLLARLEEAFARERRFISDASHELKTPLTSINANAQMLARWGDRDETIRKESLETIVAESAALAAMVNGMLTLAKADSGESIPMERLALAEAASDAVRSTTQRAYEKGLTLTFDSREPSPQIEGDPALVRQMIANLIDNAIKFTDRGSVTVRVSSENGDAVVEIADDGPGIDPEDLPLVFDRFYRADKSRSRDVAGTGLGLAIVRSIARVHGGSVRAEPRAEGGTTFRVRLPAIH
jgi:two-component system OmpR family sensor kinase